MPDPIVVVSTVDDAYLPFAAVVAQSIAASSAPGRDIAYHIFHSGTDTALAARLAAFRPGNVRITVETISNPLERFGHMGHLTPATLLRLLLPQLMAEQRIVYLDVDLMVLGDIAELADIDLGGKPAGGVTGLMAVLAARRDDPYRLLGDGMTAREHLEQLIGLSAASYRSYINSGVMVMDLKALADLDFTARTVALVEARNDRLPFRDQDAINIILKDQIALLDSAWNVNSQIVGLQHLTGARDGDIDTMRRQLAAPKCFHYAGVHKPWRQGRMLPLAGLWWHFASQTPLRDDLERLHRAVLQQRRRSPNPLRPLHQLGAALRWRGAGTRISLHSRAVS